MEQAETLHFGWERQPGASVDGKVPLMVSSFDSNGRRSSVGTGSHDGFSEVVVLVEGKARGCAAVGVAAAVVL